MTKIKDKEKAFINSVLANSKQGIPTRVMAELLYEGTGTKVNKGTILDYYNKIGYKSGIDGKFKKGHEGLSEEAKARIRSTQYKRGSTPMNLKELGARVPRSDGYIHVKVGKAKWVPEHILIWEKANGKVPEGYRIIHIDQDGTNNDLNNLMLISDAECCQINGHEKLTSDYDTNKTIVLTTRLKNKLKDIHT